MTKEQFKEIFDGYFDTVRNYVYYRSGDQELATDVAQEAFMRIWEKQLKPDKNKTKALLFKIAGDLFISNYRKQKTEQNFKLNLKPEVNFETPEDKISFEELRENYGLALQQLPEKQRTVFLMSRMDEMTYTEIAANIGLSVKAVEKRMTQALAYLKEALK
ncbi:MAG: RNA polymerase subunit sigma-24 [Bacteroidetes bacterium 4572_114]|nr:MAG: RNA polymerase subunit sigma-24 [Bacteroidetes bacterium 4572_114]